MYSVELPIRFQDADPAGVLFFARVFDLFHEAYERLMAEQGLPLEKVLSSYPFRLPVVHAEADCKAPVGVGEKVRVEIRLLKKGVTSYSLGFRVENRTGTTAATGTLVHVAVAKESNLPSALPPELLAVLDSIAGGP